MMRPSTAERGRQAAGEFTVNIALIENQRPIAGVVHAPLSGTTYYAMARVPSRWSAKASHRCSAAPTTTSEPATPDALDPPSKAMALCRLLEAGSEPARDRGFDGVAKLRTSCRRTPTGAARGRRRWRDRVVYNKAEWRNPRIRIVGTAGGLNGVPTDFLGFMTQAYGGQRTNRKDTDEESSIILARARAEDEIVATRTLSDQAMTLLKTGAKAALAPFNLTIARIQPNQACTLEWIAEAKKEGLEINEFIEKDQRKPALTELQRLVLPRISANSTVCEIGPGTGVYTRISTRSSRAGNYISLIMIPMR